MGGATIIIESRSFGIGSPQPALPDVEVLSERDEITVRDLIASAVREQISALQEKYSRDLIEVSMRLSRQYLTQEEIREQMQTGAVGLNTKKVAPLQRIDPAAEIRRALIGFERRAYRVVFDGQMLDDLDTVISLKPSSTVTFLKLVPLAGG